MLDAWVFEHTASALAGERCCTMKAQTHLYSLCMKAVWTTFGCCAAAAAPITGAGAPLGPLPVSISPFVCWFALFLSPTGLLRTGGPIVGMEDGAVSIGSRGGVSVAEPVDDGRIGMDLCRPWW